MRANVIAAMILALFVGLALSSAAAVPLFEASDEAAHFLYVHQLAQTGQLPDIPSRDDVDAAAERGNRVAQWAIESHQPPLYYALGAVLISATTRADINDYLHPNELIFNWGRRTANPNQWLHLPTPPTGDTHTAIWIMRLFSLTLACVTLWFIYRAALLASGRADFALTAMFATSVIPTFTAISASVNNDNLTTLLSTAAVWWTLRMLRFGLRKYDWAYIALIISAVALTKFTGLAVAAVVVTGLILALRRGKIARRDVTVIIAALALFTALNAGWWYARNWDLYGDPFAQAATQSLWGREFAIESESGGLLAEIPRIWQSFWLMVGHLHEPVWGPPAFYLITLILVAGGIIGGALTLIRRRVAPLSADSLIVLALTALLPVGVLIYGTRTVDISYGRLLFSGLVGIVPLLVFGWWQLVGRFAFIGVLPLLVMTVLMPFTVIRPAYPSVTAIESLPDSAVAIDIRTENGLTLLGYEPLHQRIHAGDAPPITLYLTGSDPRNPALTVSWLSPQAADDLGQLTVYPGMSPTDALPDGIIYRAIVPTQPLYAACAADAAPCDMSSGMIRIGLKWQTDGLTTLDTTDPNGNPALVLLDGPVIADPATDGTPFATFGDIISLHSAEISADAGLLHLMLDWNIRAAPPPDLTLTVQIFNDTGDFITSYDGDISGYPARAWLPDTTIRDIRALPLLPDLPAGTYHVALGWYTRADLTRLPATAAQTRDSLVVIGAIMNAP